MAFPKFGLFCWDTILGIDQVRELLWANVTGEWPLRYILNLFFVSDIVWVYLLISLWYCNYLGFFFTSKSGYFVAIYV